jgi:hypothetical protein
MRGRPASFLPPGSVYRPVARPDRKSGDAARGHCAGEIDIPVTGVTLSSTMLAQTAYAATAPVRTMRGTEYAAFQKVTARMIARQHCATRR